LMMGWASRIGDVAGFGGACTVAPVLASLSHCNVPNAHLLRPAPEYRGTQGEDRLQERTRV
jgi:hypothetical protein